MLGKNEKQGAVGKMGNADHVELYKPRGGPQAFPKHYAVMEGFSAETT